MLFLIIGGNERILSPLEWMKENNRTLRIDDMANDVPQWLYTSLNEKSLTSKSSISNKQ